MLNQLDLCSGIGVGFPLAGIQLDFHLWGLCEIDPYCRDILAKRFPEAVLYQDIQTTDWGELRHSIDIITSSPPCQPFSTQGQRRGGEDKRDCFPAVVGAIEAIQPDYWIIENVVGLLSCPQSPGAAKGSYLRNRLQELASSGYDAEWLCIGSGYFNAPWQRQRLLLVGVSKRLKLNWLQQTPWTEQIRSATPAGGSVGEKGSLQPGMAGVKFRDSRGLERPIGIGSRNGINRKRRAALGNALDPRIAEVALQRILYLNRQKYRNQKYE